MAELIVFPTVVGNLGKKTKSIHICDTDVTQANIAELNSNLMEGKGIKVGDILMITFSDDNSGLYKVGAFYTLKLYSHAT